ncbi:hypothetical protein IWQ62_004972 [Dispira parvispora]|uniref:RGS domain-containing protein n=1 Tax=Dispira parvispora TaxID=1520584 RepID=A0A9W8ALC7_9FUNG|nr:hypothetical protein IWQ62_004972 [Dispira parvispora]
MSESDPVLRRAILYPFAISLAVAALLLTAYFAYLGSRNPFFARRSVPLTVTGSLASLICLLSASVYFVEFGPCFVIGIAAVLFANVVLVIPVARTIYILLLARQAHDLAQRIAWGDSTLTTEPGRHSVDAKKQRTVWRRPWYTFSQQSLQRQLLCVCLVVVVVSVILYSGYVLTLEYYSPLDRPPFCPLGWFSYYITAITVVILVILYPVCFYFMWHLVDGYGIRNELVIYWVGALLLETTIRAVRYAGLSQFVTFLTNFMVNLLRHLWFISLFIVVPLWKLRRYDQRCTQVYTAPATPATLFQIINHPQQFFEFREYCTSLYCGELVSFLMDYQRLKVQVQCYVRRRDTLTCSDVDSGIQAIGVESNNSSEPPLLLTRNELTGSPSNSVSSPYHTIAPFITDAALSPEVLTMSSSFLSHGPVTPYKDHTQPMLQPTSPMCSLQTKTSSSTSLFTPLDLQRLPSTSADIWYSLVQECPYPTSIQDLWPSSPDDAAPIALLAAYQQIVHKYFSSDSLFEMNIEPCISSKVRIKAQDDQLTIGMFEEAQDAVVGLLIEDTLTRYQVLHRPTECTA